MNHNWISVGERLPERSIGVLVAYHSDSVVGLVVDKAYITSITGMWVTAEEHFPLGDDVRYWMPLPEPPP